MGLKVASSAEERPLPTVTLGKVAEVLGSVLGEIEKCVWRVDLIVWHWITMIMPP
jgi:hypothetical protein